MLRFDRVVMATMLLFATACGGSDPTPVTPPTAPPPTPTTPVTPVPTTIRIIAGDGQSAAAGATLPVLLSVSVSDATGAPFAGMAVRFAVDTGGGSLNLTTVTTGADGIAGGVTWTLGGSGTNVVVVSAGTLPVARFHAMATGATARTLVAAQPVAAEGGTVTYTRAGDALNGLKLTVPAAAYSTGSTWTITADSTISVPLPAGFSLAGPPLVIGNAQGYAETNMTLTVPLPINNTIATAPFYYDPTTKLLEPIPLVDRTSNTATLATHHFSADLLATPNASAGSASRAGLMRSSFSGGSVNTHTLDRNNSVSGSASFSASGSSFGNVVVVWVQIPLSLLVGTYTSNFVPGTDDWEFENWGDFISPGGDCEGMSITAMYYWYTFRRGANPNGGLFHRYDKSVANQVDNDQGIRYAGSVQGDYDLLWSAGFRQIAALNKTATALGTSAQLLTSSWIALTIKLTGQPVLIGLQSATSGHAVVAYAVTVTAGGLTTVKVADPNQPGNGNVTMNFVNGLFTPTNFSGNAGAVAQSFSAAYAVGVSSEIPIPVVAARWLQFVAKQAGSDRYPTGFTLEAQNKASGLWHTVSGQKLVVYDSILDLRTHCPSCKTKIDNPVRVWNTQGKTQIGYAPLTLTGAGSRPLWIEQQAWNGNDPGYLKADSIEIVYQAVTIDGPAQTPLQSAITYTALNPPNTPGAKYTFNWDFGDGTAAVVKNDDPVAQHTYRKQGHYVVTVTIKVTGTSELIAKATLKQNASADIVFLFTSATVTGRALPPGGIGPERSDTLAQGMIEDYLDQLTTLPSYSVLYFLADTVANPCRAVFVELFDPPALPTFDEINYGQLRGVFGSNCNYEPEMTTSLTIGTLGSGTIVGSAVDSPNLPADELLIWHGGSINARMSGRNLSGTMTWRVQYSTGIATYTFTFRALQMVPQ